MYPAGIIFFLVTVHPFLCDGKVPIADDPILEHFKMDPETEYQLRGEGFVRQLHKRDTWDNVSLTIDDHDRRLELLLNPPHTILFTPSTQVFYGKPMPNKTGGVNYVPIKDPMKKVGTLLEDSEHLASLVINRDAYGRTTVNGVARSKRANTNLVIRSVPDHVLEQHLRKRRSTSDFPDKDFSKRPDHVSHIVARVHTSQAIRYPQGARRAPGTPQINASSVVPSKMKRSAPSGYQGILYPQLLIDLDYTYYTGNSTSELTSTLEYLMAFWNAVELTYRNLSNPEFRFHVGVIVISTTPEATPYLVILTDGGPVFDTEAADYWFKVRDQIPLNLYQIAVTMTKRKIFGNVGGMAQVGFACEDPYKVKQKNAIALVSDNGGFKGTPAAIHEIGHTLGLYHDARKGSACHVEDKNIMSASDGPSATLTSFSICSKIELASLLSQEKFSCMYSNPLAGERGMPHVMPGKLMSLDQQCKKLGYRKACSVNTDQNCVRINCSFGNIASLKRGKLISEELCFDHWHQAAPGSPCGSQNDGIKRFCLFNRCLSFRG